MASRNDIDAFHPNLSPYLLTRSDIRIGDVISDRDHATVEREAFRRSTEHIRRTRRHIVDPVVTHLVRQRPADSAVRARQRYDRITNPTTIRRPYLAAHRRRRRRRSKRDLNHSIFPGRRNRLCTGITYADVISRW